MRRRRASLVICRDGPRMAALSRALAFFAPELEVLEFPAWDCLPYDRVFAACRHRRAAHDRAVAARPRQGPRPAVGRCSRPSTPCSSACRRGTSSPSRRCRPRPAMCSAWTSVIRWLELNGFIRASTVREPGDYAVRGGILDLFAPGMAEPVRLDFFGDTLETIRSFDPETQRTTDAAARARSRAGRRIPAHHRDDPPIPPRLCGGLRRGRRRDDLLYEAVSEGRRHPGMEHWLPLFHDRLETLFDYLPGAPVVLEPLAEDAARERLRPDRRLLRGAPAGACERSRPALQAAAARPALSRRSEWRERLDDAALARLTPFAVPEEGARVIDDRRPAGPQFRRRARRSRRAMCSTR